MTKLTTPLLVLGAFAVILAGCGSGGSSGSSALANCLNNRNFLVQPSKTAVDGMSPGGVNFTLTLFRDAAAATAAATGKDAKTTDVVENGVIDFGGNPGSARISKVELAAITSCIGAAHGG